MAKILDNTFKDWQETEVIHANEYKQEREIIRVAVNDNDERLGDLEESVAGVQLGNAQLQKITDDTGGVKVSVTETTGDVLAELLALGQGMHTFYAVSGSKNLPPTKISIRGIAHFTSADIGWVFATDYRNNAYTNYHDTGGWKGWNIVLMSGGVAKALDTMTLAGFSYVNPGTTGAPSDNAGTLVVNNDDLGDAFASQTFTDLDTGFTYTRTKFNNAWKTWKRLVSVSDTQAELWSGALYLQAGQTVTPTKKLSDCRNGWILVWSDYTSPNAGNFDFHYSYVPKFIGTKHNGAGNLFSVPRTPAAIIVKDVNVYNDKLTGNAGNESGDDDDVVLRYVLEW